MSTENEVLERLAVIETKQDSTNILLQKIEHGLWDKLEPRVQSLERWRSVLIGGWIVLTVVILPIVFACAKLLTKLSP